MDPLRAALSQFVPRDDREARDVARLRAGFDRGDVWSRDLALHATASALVVHPPTRRVLLRHHTRMGGWFQVGGHGDPGETDPWAIAVREAEEETGLRDLRAPFPALDRRLVQVVIVPVPAARDEPEHEHADLRYLLATDTPDAVRAEAPEAPVRWFTLPEARDVVHEPNLRAFLDRTQAMLDQPDAFLLASPTHRPTHDPEEHPA
ncbi:MAG: NUDIX domain-containing protein [Actinobacteria bacterium]|nr:NUDIX domain-containing protein [Actinomycetota bacterium]